MAGQNTVEVERLRRRLTPAEPPLEVRRAAARMKAADLRGQPGAQTWVAPEMRGGIRPLPEPVTPVQQATTGTARLVEAVPSAPPGSGPAGARRILSTSAPMVGPNVPQGMPTVGSPGPGGLLGSDKMIQPARPMQGALDFNAPSAAPAAPKLGPVQGELPLGPPSGSRIAPATPPAAPAAPATPPARPMQGALDFNAPSAAPAAPKPIPPQMELPLGPPSGSRIAPAAPTPVPEATTTAGQAFRQRMQRPTVGFEPLTPGQQFVRRMTRVSAPEPVSRMNSGLSKGLVAVELARGALDTAGRTNAKMESGQGFWPALGNTVKENLAKVADDPVGMGSISQTINAINKGDMSLLPRAPIRQPGTLRGVVPPVSATTAPRRRVAATAAPAAPQPPKTQAERIAAAGVPQGRNVITGEAPSTTEAAPTGEVFVSKGSRPGGGMEARRYVVEGVKGSASGIAPVGRTGGFAGSATDAEAARNLQARAEQDQAARFMVDSMNRGAEAERDTRAAKLGVSRGVLDRMEGRDTAAGRASATAQGQVDTPTPGAFDRPGDGYGDAQLREVQFNTLLDDAGKQTGRGSRQRAAAKIQAAMAMLQPGLSAIEADTAQRKNTAELQAAQVNQMGELEKSWMQEAGLNQRAQATNATNLDSARITQAGGLRREAMQQQGLDERVRTGNMKDAFKQGADYLTKATSPDGKNPPQVSPEKLARARGALNYAQLAEQVGEDTAKRIKSGAVIAEEAQQLVAMARQWDDNPASIWNLWTATAQPPSYIPQ